MEIEIDGRMYHAVDVEKTPMIPLRDGEAQKLDASIRSMARRVKRASITADRVLDPKHEWSREALDKIIVGTLTSLRIDVPDDPAEKLFDRIARVDADWGDDTELVEVLFYRYLSTMQALFSFKGKWRGKELVHATYSKDEARRILRERGLARR